MFRSLAEFLLGYRPYETYHYCPAAAMGKKAVLNIEKDFRPGLACVHRNIEGYEQGRANLRPLLTMKGIRLTLVVWEKS